MADVDSCPKCGECKNHVYDSQKAVQCDGRCNHWFHIVCARVSDDKYRELSRKKSIKWFCERCILRQDGGGAKEGGAAFHSPRSAELMQGNSHQPQSDLQCMKEQSNGSTETLMDNQRVGNETSEAFQKKEEKSEEIRGTKPSSTEAIWKCPMCCHKLFRSSLSLKNHIAKFLDTVHCSGCSKNVKTLQGLVKHLETECTAANATAMTSHFESPAEALNTKARQFDVESSPPFPSSCDVKGSSQALVCSHRKKEGERYADDTRGELSVQHPECAETRPRTYFSCSVCRITFSSVEEHVKLYHSQQDVLVNRLGSREFYRPQRVQKRVGDADKGVSKVLSKFVRRNSGQKQCNVNNVSYAKTGSENNNGLAVTNVTKTVTAAGSSNVCAEKCLQQYNVCGNLGDELDRKRRKILKVVLTRIPDEKLNKFLKPSCKEGDKNKESDSNGVSSICDARKETSTVSEQLKRKILSTIFGEGFDGAEDKTVKTDNTMMYKSCKKQNTVTKRIKMHDGDRLCNTINRQYGESRTESNVTKESNIAVNSHSVVQRVGASTSDTKCRTAKNNEVSCLESTSVVEQQSAQLSSFNVRTVAGKEFSGFETPVSTMTLKSIQSFGSFSGLLATVGVPGAEETSRHSNLASTETLHRGTQYLMFNSNGIPVSGMWCSTSLVLNSSGLPRYMVSRKSGVSGEEMSKCTRTMGSANHELATCDCVKNKAEDLIVNEVIDESGKKEQNLYVCVKCSMGFTMHMHYYKHICDKDNFVCTCVKIRHKAKRKRNVENQVVISEPEVLGSTEVMNSGSEGTGAEVVPWRKMLAVTTSKNLLCSVCSNMFMNDSSSFSDQSAVAVRVGSFPQNDNSTTANYTCQICSIVTEKRRGRVLVSKVNDSFKEAVEIVVVDPNEDCDMGT